MMIESLKEEKINVVKLDDTCGIINFEELTKFDEYIYEKYDIEFKFIRRGVLGTFLKKILLMIDS